MKGKGFLTHLGKDRFEVSNVGVGRDFKKIQIKLLKKDMVDILKKYGRDYTGKKDEVIRKFVEFMKKVPKLWNPAQAPDQVSQHVSQPHAKPQPKPDTKPAPKPAPEFIPLEEAMPQFKSKPKITPFIPLEEAVPQFQSKNIKITPKPKATAVVYGTITRPRVIQPKPVLEPVPEPKKPKKEIKPNFKSKNAFDILGVDENTSEKDIKTRYRELSRIYHPDKLGNADIQSLLNRAYQEIMDRQDILSVARERRAKEQEKFDLIDKKKLDEDFKKSLKIIKDSKAKGKTNLIKQLKLFKTYRANKFTASVQIQMRKDYDAFRQALIDNGLQEVVDLADTLFFMKDMR